MKFRWSRYREIDDTSVFNIFALSDAEILKHRAVLIDTPGLNTDNKAAAALTDAALKIADAVILVVDETDTEDHDRRLIERLKEEGLADKLFVVMNRMEFLSADERKALVESRTRKHSEWGVMTKVYPLSETHKLDATDGDFLKFREALVSYIDNGLQSAREIVVGQRVKTVAAYFSSRIGGYLEAGRERDAGRREVMRQDALVQIRQVEDGCEHLKNEIGKLKSNVVAKWGVKKGSLMGQVDTHIQNTSEGALKSLPEGLAFI